MTLLSLSAAFVLLCGAQAAPIVLEETSSAAAPANATSHDAPAIDHQSFHPIFIPYPIHGYLERGPAKRSSEPIEKRSGLWNGNLYNGPGGQPGYWINQNDWRLYQDNAWKRSADDEDDQAAETNAKRSGLWNGNLYNGPGGQPGYWINQNDWRLYQDNAWKRSADDEDDQAAETNVKRSGLWNGNVYNGPGGQPGYWINENDWRLYQDNAWKRSVDDEGDQAETNVKRSGLWNGNLYNGPGGQPGYWINQNDWRLYDDNAW